MADLKRRHAYRRWAPDIGENRELEGGPALWFEVATGLTAQQLMDARNRFAELRSEVAGQSDIPAIKAKLSQAFLEAFGEFLRVVGGPHTVGQKSLASIADYIDIVQEQADFGQLALKDLVATIERFNSFGGPDELFLQRRSGGEASTPPRSAAKEEPPTVGP